MLNTMFLMVQQNPGVAGLALVVGILVAKAYSLVS